MAEEVEGVIAAGLGAVPVAILDATYYAIKKPKIGKKLKQELELAWPNLDAPPRYETIRALPYLVSVVRI